MSPRKDITIEQIKERIRRSLIEKSKHLEPKKNERSIENKDVIPLSLRVNSFLRKRSLTEKIIYHGSRHKYIIKKIPLLRSIAIKLYYSLLFKSRKKEATMSMVQKTKMIIRQIPLLGFVIWWIYMLVKAPSKISKIYSMAEALESRNEGLESKTGELVSEIDGLKARNEGLESKTGELVSEIDGLKARNEGLESKTGELVSEVDGLKARNEGLESKTGELVSEIDGLKARNEGLESVINKISFRINRLEREKEEKVTTSTYLNPLFVRHIEKSEVKIVFEVGGYDATDSLKIRDFYGADHVYCLECNPEAIKICRNTLSGQPNVTLIEKAAWDKTESIKFYRVVKSFYKGEEGRNIAASSCFRESGLYASTESYIQEEIEVCAVRLDDLCSDLSINNIDLICMDVQGAALHVLKGLGNLLSKVKYIITELEIIPIFEGESLLPEVVDYLCHRDFELVSLNMECPEFGNFMFVRKDHR